MFGVGATKSGTSWLYRYLSGHPECFLRTVKELHFFDALDEGRVEARIGALETLKRQLERRAGAGRTAEVLERARRIADIEHLIRVFRKGDEGAYLDYLNDGRGERRLIADITPSYALLPEGRLERMAGMSADVRFVYLLRDPVARLWSHVRMLARRRSATGRDLETRAEGILERALSDGEGHILRRGDYRAALTRLGAAVSPARLLTLFYEELFTAPAIARLCRFLGIAEHPGETGKRVHEGVALNMREEQRRRAVALLAPQYEFVEARLGRLPDAWQASRVGM